MKVLVIDDTKKHLDSAVKTLEGHEVTICDNHDEALKLLYPQYDHDLFRKLWKDYEEAGLKDAYEKARAESTFPYWDAVLCDLLMPAGRNAQGGEGTGFIGQEMAVGWSLALSAVKNGAKFVAVVTDMNHHHHPASAMIDEINGHIFDIDGARMLLTNYNVCCMDESNGKDWGRILKRLLGQEEENEVFITSTLSRS